MAIRFVKQALSQYVPPAIRANSNAKGSAAPNLRSWAVARCLESLTATKRSSLNAFEIGCMFSVKEGLSTQVIASALNPIPRHRFISIEASIEHIEAAKSLLDAASSSLRQSVEFRHGHSLEVLPNVIKDLGTVDFAFLDGGAHPEVCLHEFEMTLEALTPDGLIVIDDLQDLGPTEAYPMPRPMGKGTLILPMLVVAEYLAVRGEYLLRNHGIAPSSDFVNSQKVSRWSDLMRHRSYLRLGQGQHQLLFVGPTEALQAISHDAGEHKFAKTSLAAPSLSRAA